MGLRLSTFRWRRSPFPIAEWQTILETCYRPAFCQFLFRGSSMSPQRAFDDFFRSSGRTAEERREIRSALLHREFRASFGDMEAMPELVVRLGRQAHAGQ